MGVVQVSIGKKGAEYNITMATILAAVPFACN